MSVSKPSNFAKLYAEYRFDALLCKSSDVCNFFNFEGSLSRIRGSVCRSVACSCSISCLFPFQSLKEVYYYFSDLWEVNFENSRTCITRKTCFEDLSQL